MKKIQIEGFRAEDLRTDKDLTQKEVAEKLNMHLTTYREYEQQERRIPATFIIELAELYNVSIDYIAGLTNDKRKYWWNAWQIKETVV